MWSWHWILFSYCMQLLSRGVADNTEQFPKQVEYLSCMKQRVFMSRVAIAAINTAALLSL